VNVTKGDRALNIGVFACSHFGIYVLEYFLQTKRKLQLIALDSKNFHDCNDRVLELAEEFDCEVLYSSELYNNINRLYDFNLDIIILGWWPYIIREPLIDVPRIGFLNIHPSYLPYGRGKFSSFWAIVEETPYGATMHFIDAGIDTGKLVAQQKVEIDWEDTGKTLYSKGLDACKEVFIKNIENVLNEDFKLYDQDESIATNHYSSEFHTASEVLLDKEYSARQLINHIRAGTFKPYPSAYFYDNGEKYEITVEINKCE